MVGAGLPMLHLEMSRLKWTRFEVDDDDGVKDMALALLSVGEEVVISLENFYYFLLNNIEWYCFVDFRRTMCIYIMFN